MRSIDRRRLRRSAPAAAGAVVFVAVLAVWTATGRVTPSGDPAPAEGRSGVARIPDPTGAPRASASGSGAASGPVFSSDAPPDLSQISGGVSAQDGSRHRVTLRAKSDRAIGQLYYYIRGGKPEKGKLVSAASPVVVTSEASGTGLTAEIWMQSSIYATTTTCTITIDGQVRSTRTVKGGYNVAICIA